MYVIDHSNKPISSYTHIEMIYFADNRSCNHLPCYPCAILVELKPKLIKPWEYRGTKRIFNLLLIFTCSRDENHNSSLSDYGKDEDKKSSQLIKNSVSNARLSREWCRHGFDFEQDTDVWILI